MFLTAIATVALGQEPDNNAVNQERPRINRSLNYGNWVGKHIMSKAFTEQAGISDEQAKKIKEEMGVIDAQLKALDETINQAAIQQAEIAKKVLSEPGAKVDEVMKMIDHIGQLRTEQAKLATQILVVIRDNLTDEQRKAAQELITAEAQKRFMERVGRREKDEREHPAGHRPPLPRHAAPPRPVAPKGW